MLDEHAGSSKTCKSTGYERTNTKKSYKVIKNKEIIEIDANKNMLAKVSPIIKESAVLAKSFLTAMKSVDAAKKVVKSLKTKKIGKI